MKWITWVVEVNGFGAQQRAESAQEQRDTSVYNEEGRAYGHRGRKEVILSKSEYKDMNCL